MQYVRMRSSNLSRLIAALALVLAVVVSGLFVSPDAAVAKSKKSACSVACMAGTPYLTSYSVPGGTVQAVVVPMRLQLGAKPDLRLKGLVSRYWFPNGVYGVAGERIGDTVRNDWWINVSEFKPTTKWVGKGKGRHRETWINRTLTVRQYGRSSVIRSHSIKMRVA